MKPKEQLSKWLHDNLSAVLSFPVPPDLTEYILTIENERDIDDYLKTLLDLSDPRHKKFLENFKLIRHCNDDKKFHKKNDEFKENEKPGKKKESEPDSATKHKKKTKFVNIFSPEGERKDIIFLKGRHHCDCQASKHQLINNCLKCGRIVCAQEGSGPCIFCGNLVCTKEEQDFINTNTKQSKKLYQNLMDSGKPDGWEKAMEQRDRLLEYDKTSQKRTKVIDDEGEYFSSSSSWLTKDERERMAKKEAEVQSKKHGSRLEKKITLDFAGRRVIEEDEEEFTDDFYADALDKIEDKWNQGYSHPDFSGFQPMFLGSAQNSNSEREWKGEVTDLKNSIIQDKEYLEMSDNGACLSMHQPWASLLVSGIKKHEGRTWYTSHRGRLWIAATSKPPTDQEIKEIENLYRVLTGDDNLAFPSSYPISCLLGCVIVTDCLPQEEYRKKYPDGESESPFVFICEEPKELSLRFPITGRHKIYKLDGKIHQAAKKALLRLAKEEKAKSKNQ